MKKMNQATVILVDDDPLVRDSATRLLQEFGLRVEPCSAGHEALERLRRGGVDAVLSDIKMPGLSGLELLEKIREFDPEIPVLLMTGYADLQMAVTAIQGGVFDFILKPFNPLQLFHSVEKALSFKYLRAFEKNSQSEFALRLVEAKREYRECCDQLLKEERLSVARVVDEVDPSAAVIAGNLSILQGYVEQLLELLTAQGQAITTYAPVDVREAFAEQRRRIDLDHIRKIITPLLAGSLEGAERIQQVVRDLNPISEPDAVKIQLD